MRTQRGFTLIEVIVAAAVLGMAAVALFGLLSGSLSNLHKVEDLRQYELAAQEVMNRVLLISNLPAPATAEGRLEERNATWTVKISPWWPSNLDAKPEEAVLKIDVVLTWPGRSSRRSIMVEALKLAKIEYSNYDLPGTIESVFPQ